MDEEANIQPLFEIQLLLEAIGVVFSPSAEIDSLVGFYALYEEIMLDIMRMATLIPRVDPDREDERPFYTV